MRGVEARLRWFLTNRPAASGRCAEHTMQALDIPRQGLPDATAVARVVMEDRNMQQGPVPRGAMRYWTGGSGGHGHVAIEHSEQDQPAAVASTDVGGPRTVGVRAFSWFGRSWPELKYVGWSWYFGATDTQPKESTVAWNVGENKVLETTNATVAAGRYVTVGSLTIPKPGSYLLTLQTRLPAGKSARIQFVRIGWGSDPDGKDETGPDPLTPPDELATSFTRNHEIDGGGPVAFQIKVGGSGSVTLPYVICKARRIT